jgi:two-component system chemotaxis response regulator CheY
MIDRVRGNPEIKDLPIIVVSTEGSENRINRLMEKGVRFIHKPFSPEVIRETVNAVLGIE